MEPTITVLPPPASAFPMSLVADASVGGDSTPVPEGFRHLHHSTELRDSTPAMTRVVQSNQVQCQL